MGPSQKRDLLVSKTWLQAIAVVMLFGFFVLGLLAYETYTGEAPIPARVTGPGGELLFTRDDILGGQQIFLRNGLMEYGSVFGHGAYLGPDFTADYLRRAALMVLDAHGGAKSDSANRQTVDDFKTNRYDAASDTLTFSEAQTSAFNQLKNYYRAFFDDPTTRNGLRPHAISAAQDTDQLTAFFAWSAWAGAALRPGKDYSYTNNWPPEPLVGNHVTADTVLWSVLSLIALLGGIGLLFAAFGRWNFLGWHGRERKTLSFREPGTVPLTPAQRVCAWFFLVMAALFLLQTLVGAASQHYRAEISNFFGIDLAQILPYNLARTWHLQLAIFWVATSFLAAGIFIAPMIGGREPKPQKWMASGLLAALAVVVFGSLAGEYAGIYGWIHSGWKWFGDQGFEYLDLGRFWQILLTLGLCFWVLMLYLALRGRLKTEHKGNMPWLFLFSALAIPAFYAVGLLAQPDSHFTTTDFWRFWVVHLWVEDFLELFTTIMVACIFVLLGVVAERVALTVIYLDILLYSAGGMIGTMHHVYFSGTPAQHMALGAFFSAAEVIPLTFLTVEAWSFLQLGAQQQAKSRKPFPHYWAVMFLVAVGFWNFLGAGVFGFLINLPVVSYYEIGTALTANHGHAAMMGVYGMLAVGLALFCIRYMIPEQLWSDRAAKISFWSLNIGLAWMVFATLFPLGLLQLYESVHTGYFDARTAKYLTSDVNAFIEWLRLPGDALFIAGGVLPVLYLCWLGVRHADRRIVAEEPETVLFAEVSET
ncbi:MAG TPA: cbb3-type cytochrome c oxidase subunit I [Bryobacteraceae bacterium]|nr:cbb3-type cytochrome c oxidase subunit I [Bryobacteraceae bacterium]